MSALERRPGEGDAGIECKMVLLAKPEAKRVSWSAMYYEDY